MTERTGLLRVTSLGAESIVLPRITDKLNLEDDP
jgi:hypothetical protein